MASPGHGGKREGGGRKTEFSEKRQADLFREAIAAFEEQAMADLPQVYAAIRDAACGLKLLVKIEWKGQRRLLIETDEEFEDSRGQPLHLYTLRPEPAAQRIFIEHAKGRAATQPRVETDTIINVVHQVPRPAVAAPKPGSRSPGEESTGEQRERVWANIDAERKKARAR